MCPINDEEDEDKNNKKLTKSKLKSSTDSTETTYKNKQFGLFTSKKRKHKVQETELKNTEQIVSKDSIPLTSLEVFKNLHKIDAQEKIELITRHFLYLVNSRISELRDNNNKKLDNDSFISQLKTVSKRIARALENEEPYHYFLGDVVKLQILFQTIIAYYDRQLTLYEQLLENLLPNSLQQNARPDAKIILDEWSDPRFSTHTEDISSILTSKAPLLKESEAEFLAQHATVHAARNIMAEDLKLLKRLVMSSFLDEPDFSYLKK